MDTEDLFPSDPFIEAGLTFAENMNCALQWGSYSVDAKARVRDLAASPLPKRKAAVAAWREAHGQAELGLPGAL